MNNKRLNRISGEVKKIVSEVIANDIKDPRVNPLTTVTNVEVTRDLSYANIYISVLGNDKEKQETLDGLVNAKGFIRSAISSRVDLRYTPEPKFHLDESIEQGMYISKLIESVNKEESKDEIDD